MQKTWRHRERVLHITRAGRCGDVVVAQRGALHVVVAEPENMEKIAE